MTEKGQRTGCRMMRIIAVSILGLILFSGSAYAARENGEVIFGKDLTVGEKVTVQIATDMMKDAFVVKEGECPRLVLLENLGANCVYKASGGEGANRAYELSDLKIVMDTRTTGHGAYIVNISAPFLEDVARENDYSSSPTVIDTALTAGGAFWTRTPRNYSLPNDNISVLYDHGQVAFIPGTFSTLLGVRPAFNLKSDTVLKYDDATSKYTVTTDPGERAKAYFLKYGYYTTLLVPEGQAPAGYTAISGYSGFYYKQVNDRYVIAYAQEYTVPTSIGDLNIN